MRIWLIIKVLIAIETLVIIGGPTDFSALFKKRNKHYLYHCQYHCGFGGCDLDSRWFPVVEDGRNPKFPRPPDKKMFFPFCVKHADPEDFLVLREKHFSRQNLRWELWPVTHQWCKKFIHSKSRWTPTVMFKPYLYYMFASTFFFLSWRPMRFSATGIWSTLKILENFLRCCFRISRDPAGKLAIRGPFAMGVVKISFLGI